MGKRRKRRIYTCSDKILCGLGRMYAGGGELTENIVAKTANHSWKNGRSSGSCVK